MTDWTANAAKDKLLNQAEEQRVQDLANQARAVELEKKATGLALKERDLALRERDLEAEKAAAYEQFYRALLKKPGGLRCFLKRLFTLGIVRCG